MDFLLKVIFYLFIFPLQSAMVLQQAFSVMMKILLKCVWHRIIF